LAFVVSQLFVIQFCSETTKNVMALYNIMYNCVDLVKSMLSVVGVPG